jgi:hypothetical protein
VNLNGVSKNFPTVDLLVVDKVGSLFGVSVKAKDTATWPRVKGIENKCQVMVFLDYQHKKKPDIYILDHLAWNRVLRGPVMRRLHSRKKPGTPAIVKGAIEWPAHEQANNRPYRGCYIELQDVAKYKDNWMALLNKMDL